MNVDEIQGLYDAGYAAEYDEKFLQSPLCAADTIYEVELLGTLIEPGASWLDVGCGTGYYMSRFPHAMKTGIDLSEAMLDIARARIPAAALFQQNYLDDRAEWAGRFDVVSCMWYVYGFVETLRDLDRLIANLASWTSADGTCFVPLADPSLITGVPLSVGLSNGGFAGEIAMPAIVWTFSEYDGKKVHHLLAPLPEYMVERFGHWFSEVELIRYPPAFPGWTGRPAIIARKKREHA